MAKTKKSPVDSSLFSIWRKKIVHAVKTDPVPYAVLGAGLLLAFIAFAFYLSGFIKQNVTGEAFYDFQYPYRYTFLESWKAFFFDRIRSRLMHGVLVSALFHAFGFNPPAYYLSALLLVISSSVFIVLALRPFVKSTWIALLLVVAFTWLPFNLPDLMSLKKLHHALAWFFFWLAVFLWQRWVTNRRFVWLAAATLAFLGSILAYEVAIALLPIAVLLSLPNLKNRGELIGNLGMALWITLLSGLVFLDLEHLKTFSSIESVYTVSGWDLGNLLRNTLAFLPQLPAAAWSSSLMEVSNPINALIGKLILIFCVIFASLIVWRNLTTKRSIFKEKNLSLVLSGLWLSLAGYLPFILAGQLPDSDGLRGAAFGFLLLGLAAAGSMAEQGREKLGNLVLSVISVFWIFTGLTIYSKGIATSRQEDIVLQNVTYTLKQQIPDIAEKSTFVFINSSLGRTGCIGFVNMLYDRSDLHCIHLLSNDTQESYTRTGSGLLETGGRLFAERFIIVTFDERGFVTVMDQLSPDDIADLPVIWESRKPLITNRSLIYQTVSSYARNFDLYNYMMAQYSAR